MLYNVKYEDFYVRYKGNYLKLMNMILVLRINYINSVIIKMWCWKELFLNFCVIFG